MKQAYSLLLALLLMGAGTTMAQTTHEYVDLGLPSGTLWATCNVGANTPEEYGDYFAWGDTSGKDYYDYSNYKYCNGSFTSFTKYCTMSEYGYNGFTDDKTVLDPEDDAATVNMGSSWCTPSRNQLSELIGQCTKKWTQQNGVDGFLFTGPNGNTLFLPAAGYKWEGELNAPGFYGSYRSNSISRNGDQISYYLWFDSNGNCKTEDLGGRRAEGNSVRAVRVQCDVYTEFVEETGTLTYYYDSKKESRTGITEFFDPIKYQGVVRFASYYDKVKKVVIDPSMKDAPLTSFRNMSYGGMDSETLTSYVLTNVTSIQGLSNLNTSIVTDMNSMFIMCSSLTSLDLSSFNTSNVTNMNGMFMGCSKLQALDLSSFDVSNVTDMRMMIASCSELTTIYCNKDWSQSLSHEASYIMFSGCKKLVGDMGTTFDTNMIDAAYARPDGGTAAPGYFTRVGAIRGDVNHDEKVNTADVVAVYSFIEGGAESGFARADCDVNRDGKANTADVVAIYSIIIKGDVE